MKRTNTVLFAAALGGLCAAAHAGGAKEAPAGWPTILGLETNLADAGSPVGQAATVDRSRILASSGGCTGLWDNNTPNGDNGYSNGADFLDRGLLDDFEVPPNQSWTINRLIHSHVWDMALPGTGTGFVLRIWPDIQGQPDPNGTILDANVTNYLETPGPDMYFERPEAISFTTFDDIVLPTGRYWVEGAILGPENNFWLTSDQRDEECWVNYSDFNGLESGSAQFGGPNGINWCLEGTTDGGQALRQFGMWQTALGNAILDNTGSTLQVMNIGSSGKDGVSANIGNSGGGWCGHAQAPTGATMVLRNIGTVDGAPGTALGFTTVREAGGTTFFNVNLTGLNATMYTRNIYLGDALVQSISLPQDLELPLTNDPVGTGTCSTKRLGMDNIMMVIELDAPVLVTGINEMADRLEVIPQGAVPLLEGLTDFDLEIAFAPADGNNFVIDDEALVMFGNEHRRTGQARLTTDAGVLRVSNLGSSGLDGVSIDVDHKLNLDVDLEPVTGYADGSNQFLMSAEGCADDTPDSPIGASNIVSNGGFTVVQGDFAPISAGNNVRVEVWDDGVLVDSYVKAGGGTFVGALESTNPPDPLPGIVVVGQRPVAETGFFYKFDGNLIVQENIGQPFAEGDEVRVLSSDPDVVVSSVSNLTIRTKGISSLGLTGEDAADGPACGGGPPATGACCLVGGVCMVLTEDACGVGGGDYQGNDIPCEPETCPTCTPGGDLDGSGCVDFADILIILAAWGSPGPEGDANCDGVVDFADILVVLAEWGTGPNCP